MRKRKNLWKNISLFAACFVMWGGLSATRAYPDRAAD